MTNETRREQMRGKWNNIKRRQSEQKGGMVSYERTNLFVVDKRQGWLVIVREVREVTGYYYDYYE